MARVGPKVAQVSSKLSLSWPKSDPRWPKSATGWPNWFQVGPDSRQVPPKLGKKWVQVAPKLAKDCIKADIPKTYKFPRKNNDFIQLLGHLGATLGPIFEEIMEGTGRKVKNGFPKRQMRDGMRA